MIERAALAGFLERLAELRFSGMVELRLERDDPFLDVVAARRRGLTFDLAAPAALLRLARGGRRRRRSSSSRI